MHRKFDILYFIIGIFVALIPWIFGIDFFCYKWILWIFITFSITLGIIRNCKKKKYEHPIMTSILLLLPAVILFFILLLRFSY